MMTGGDLLSVAAGPSQVRMTKRGPLDADDSRRSRCKLARLTIDGRSLECADGTTVLEAARSIGIEIPTLCHDDRLEPTGACRLCLVEVDGLPRPIPACSAPVHDGMTVHTVSPALAAARRMMLEMLAEHHPPGVLPDAAAKPFHRLIEQHGIAPGGPASDVLVDDTHPYIRVDMSRCIDCFRCVRICDEVQGQDVWHVLDRGAETRHSSRRRHARDRARAWAAARVSTPVPRARSRIDGVLEHGARHGVDAHGRARTAASGCELEVGTRDGRDRRGPPRARRARQSRDTLCVKGRYAFDFVHAPDRVTTPHVRESGRWRRASWQEAIGVAAAGLRRDRRSPRPRRGRRPRLGAGDQRRQLRHAEVRPRRASARTTSTAARACVMRRARPRSKMMLGAGAATNCFDDIEHAQHDPRLRRQRHRESSGRRRPHPPGGAPRRVAHRDRSAADRAGRAKHGASIWRCGPGPTCRCSTRWPTSSSTEGLVDDAFRGAAGRRAGGVPGRGRRLDARTGRGGLRRDAAADSARRTALRHGQTVDDRARAWA